MLRPTRRNNNKTHIEHNVDHCPRKHPSGWPEEEDAPDQGGDGKVQGRVRGIPEALATGEQKARGSKQGGRWTHTYVYSGGTPEIGFNYYGGVVVVLVAPSVTSCRANNRHKYQQINSRGWIAMAQSVSQQTAGPSS